MFTADFELNSIEMGARVAVYMVNADTYSTRGMVYALLADANPNSSFANTYYED